VVEPRAIIFFCRPIGKYNIRFLAQLINPLQLALANLIGGKKGKIAPNAIDCFIAVGFSQRIKMEIKLASAKRHRQALY
jgi:hypothetical protein